MKKLITLSIILIILGFTNVSRAATFTAVANGDWSDPATWDQGARPNCGSTIIIPAGITVTVTQLESYIPGGCTTPMRVEVYGDLVFNGGKLRLPEGSEIYVYPGGRITEVGPGSGNSSTIEIAGGIVWNADSPPITGPSSLPDGLLPIELTYFKAKAVNIDKTLLNWQTITETNNQFFTIERSGDGLHFESIHTLNGAGNSNSIINYEWVDNSSLPGGSYYRLKQTDFNGDFSYSGIEFVEHNNKELSINVYPNPSDGDVTIAIPEGISGNSNELTLKVKDITGKIILESKLDYSNTNMKVSLILDKGFYTISVESPSTKLAKSTVIH